MIHLAIVSVLVILSTVLLGLFLTNAELLPVQASLQAETVDWLFDVHWWFIASQMDFRWLSSVNSCSLSSTINFLMFRPPWILILVYGLSLNSNQHETLV